MRTVIIGGGKGCESLLKLATGTFLKELTLDIRCVMDIDPNAPGMKFARRLGIHTSTDMIETLRIRNIELIIELTGDDKILSDIFKLIPTGAKMIDHKFAHVFWDLVNAQKDQELRIEEQNQLEKKIENERQFLQNVFDSIPDLVVVLDKDRRVIRVNKPFAEYTGISKEDVADRVCGDIFRNTELAFNCDEFDAVFTEVLTTGQPQTIIRKTPPPNEIHWEITLKPVSGADHIPAAILSTWHRITEKVMLRREVESAELKFRRFIESAHAMISIKDLDSRYMIVNSATAQKFNLKPEDFVGKRPDDILPRDLATRINKHDREVIKHNQHQTYEEQIEINGKFHYFNTIRFPLTDYKGAIIGTCTIDRDITREKELQDQLVQTTKLAAVGKLAAGVAHEINNPLTGILAYAEDIQEELPQDSDFQEDLGVIIRETMRCRDIVRNLLDFARMDTPQFQQIHPNDVIDQALSLVSRLVNFQDINIKKKLTDESCVISGDPHQLTQVILNFMVNAADAMEGKGTITLLTECLVKNDKVMISVADTGPGIPENLIDKIFEPFFSTKGTNGLGLAVSWGIIERHRGSIEVDMADDGGTIFKIILPIFKNEK